MQLVSRDLIDDRELREWIAKRWSAQPEQILIETLEELRTDPQYTVYCEREVLPLGDFRLSIALWEPKSSLSEEYEDALRLVADFETEILWDHHEANPYEYLHLRPGSPPMAVVLRADLLDDEGCFAISRVVSEEHLGAIYSTFPIPRNRAREHLSSCYGVEPGAIDSRSSTNPSGPVPSTSHEVSPRVGELLFNHRLDIWFHRPREWNLPSVRSQEWLAGVATLANDLDSPLCAYHPSYQTTRNIPGGTDSETYCMHIEQGSSRRIPLKSCRTSY